MIHKWQLQKDYLRLDAEISNKEEDIMKQTASFSLEQDIIDFIGDYKKKYNLSSRSTALERIILAFKMGQVYDGDIEDIVKNSITVDKIKSESVKSKKDTVDNIINESYNSMPD